MAAQKVIPSLSLDGWVTSPDKILDYVLSHYILTDNQQSYLYRDNLTSLPLTYYKYNSDPDGMANGIRTDLTNLLTKYFSQVDVSASAVQSVVDLNIYNVVVSAAVIGGDGKRYELNKITQLFNSKARYILNFSNYGAAVAHFKSVIGS